MRYFWFVLFAIAIVSCGDDNDEGTRLTMIPQQFEIPAGLNPLFSHNFTNTEISTERIRFEQETGVQWEDWTRIQPARARLTITEPGLFWSFMNEVTIRAFKIDDPTQTREIFYRDQIRDDQGAQLDLIPGDLDISSFLDGDEFGIILELRRLRSSPTQSLPIQLDWSFASYTE